MGGEIASALAKVDLATFVAIAALVLLVWIVIKLGKVLIMAALFGLIAGAASLSQGYQPRDAALQAAIAFAGAAIIFFVIKLTKNFLIWLTLTLAGVAGLLLFGVHRIT